MFGRYGAFIARHARLVLVLSGVALVAMAVVGSGAFGKLRGGGSDDPASPSSVAQRVIDARFGGSANLVLLVHAKGGSVDAAAARQAGSAVATDLAAEPGVTNVVSYWATGAPSLRSTDGTDALVLAHVTGDPDQVTKTTQRLIDGYTGDRPDIRISAGGTAAIGQDISSQVKSSLAVAEAIAVPVTLLLLVLAFGSLVAAALPLVIGGVAIMATFAELYVLGSVTDVSVFAINLTTALGLALGVDYALLMVARFREELAGGLAVPAAVARTVETAGRTVLFSALTVGLALTAMLVFPPFFLRSFGYAGIGVVVVCGLAALVVAPALLAVLGTRVNAGRVPWSRAVRGSASTFWRRLATMVVRHPVRWALPALAGLLLMAAPLLHISFSAPDRTVLPASSVTRQTADRLQNGFAGNESTAMDVVFDRPVGTGPLAGYAARLSELPGVSRVDSSAGTFVAGQAGPTNPADAALGRPDAQRLSVVTNLVPQSDPAQRLVATIRAVPGPDGATPLVGGVDAQLVDTKHSIGSRLPLAGLIVLGTALLVLFLFTGSVVQPLRALVLQMLTLGATVGVLTWVFQDGHLASLLGFTPRPMDTAMTVLMFCVTFGLSMDYEVIVISRIKEIHDQGADPVSAVVGGLSRTGRLVSTASALMAVSFFAFLTGSVSFLQMFGLGSGLAILLDATVVRGVLVPAVLRVLGRAAWWSPRLLRGAYGRIGLREAEPVEV
jgi:putative drug exporter of the RND superfamily